MLILIIFKTIQFSTLAQHFINCFWDTFTPFEYWVVAVESILVVLHNFTSLEFVSSITQFPEPFHCPIMLQMGCWALGEETPIYPGSLQHTHSVHPSISSAFTVAIPSVSSALLHLPLSFCPSPLRVWTWDGIFQLPSVSFFPEFTTPSVCPQPTFDCFIPSPVVPSWCPKFNLWAVGCFWSSMWLQFTAAVFYQQYPCCFSTVRIALTPLFPSAVWVEFRQSWPFPAALWHPCSIT